MVNRGADKSMVLMTDKKGMFFTLFVIVVLTLFLVSVSFYSFVKERKPIQTRITTLNNLIDSIEKDMSRQLFISGYRGVVSLQSYITDRGGFIINTEESLKEALLNGSVNSTSMGLMEGYTLEDWKPKVEALGNKLNLDINYSILSVELVQDDPWSIKIRMEANFSIRDKTELARWERVKIIETMIKIDGFEDPIYLLNTNGLITNKFIRSPFSFFVSGPDVSNLFNHTQNSYYIASSSAPSFLDRFEGKTSANTNGIESIVNLNELSAQGIPLLNKPVVDYIYFSSSNPGSCNVLPNGMPSWFKLDDSHLAVYQVSCS